MFGIKSGTQTWSNAQQQVDLGRDSSRSVSAADQEKFFGDQNVGEVLNKIADPNWVDPAKAQRHVGDSQMDKDAFMKLLLTQMKYQDPTNPMQSHEMAAQLAQFTSLEKLTNINESINALTKAQAPSQNFDALSMIGKAVVADSGRINRMDETDSHSITFQLAADAMGGEVRITDPEGKVIRKLALTNLKSGRNEINWNGKDEDGRTMPKGNYSVAIEARGSNGNKIFADTHFEGVITGVNFTSQGPMLMIGKQTVPLKDIKEITDPQLLQMSQAPVPFAGQPGPTDAKAKAHSQLKPKTTQPGQPIAGNLESVGMSRGLINQLNRSGAKAGI